jgi:myosin-crossreactive antigen
MPDRMPEKNVEVECLKECQTRMSETIYIYMPYIRPDEMSETMTK